MNNIPTDFPNGIPEERLHDLLAARIYDVVPSVAPTESVLAGARRRRIRTRVVTGTAGLLAVAGAVTAVAVEGGHGGRTAAAGQSPTARSTTSTTAKAHVPVLTQQLGLAAGQKAPACRDMVLHGGGEQNDLAGSSIALPLGDDHFLSRTSPPEQPSLECRGARPSSAAVSSKLFVCLITCDHLTAPSRRRRPCADGVGALWPSQTMCRAPFGFSRLILTGWHRRCVSQMRARRKRNENWSGRRAAPSGGKTSVTTCQAIGLWWVQQDSNLRPAD